MSLKVIKPLTITDAMLTSTSIAEPDLTFDPAGIVAWSTGTSYALKALVYGTDHLIYESLQAANLAHNPLFDVQNNTVIPPVYWLARNDLGKTNRWQCLDLLRNLKSKRLGNQTFVITPGVRIDSLGLFGLEADSVTITIVNGATTIYTKTLTTSTRIVTNWFDYFFKPFTNKKNYVFFDIPPYTNSVITVTLNSTTTSALGSFVIGNQVDMGNILYGAQSDVINPSRIDRTFDGAAILLQRQSTPKVNAVVLAKKTSVDSIRELRVFLNAMPAVWAGIDQVDDAYFESLLILGIYRQFVINLDYQDYVKINLEIEEI